MQAANIEKKGAESQQGINKCLFYNGTAGKSKSPAKAGLFNI